ncbi:MAG: metallophosphoesterase [Anaeroplasmataceae bacterium]|nr:metallophosphoesterase [Anaeroplasmataceae bacterium]
MQKNKKTKILHLNIPTDKRLIFMSDIHGDIQLFKKALEKVQFCSNDYLFVIGDMIEKGDPSDNLAMLKYIIELNKQENVYFMAGNCDEVFRFILPPLDKKRFLYYATELKKSVINDMAEEMKYPIHKEMDIEDYIKTIEEKYPEYFKFVDELPDVVFINDSLVLVHGGIMDIDHIPENALDVLKCDRFLELSPIQPKIMIVGHNPTRNYRADIPCVNPIFDFRKNIICLDGGNNVVKGGQINVVSLNSLSSMNFSFFAIDHYPKYIVEEDITYEQPKNQFTMRFGKNEVELITKDLDFYLIRPKGTTDELWVHEEFIFEVDGKHYCYDGSNTFLSLKKGDQISVIKKAKPYSLIKHDGIVGLIESKYIHDDLL